jgi:hypothetical protein
MWVVPRRPSGVRRPCLTASRMALGPRYPQSSAACRVVYHSRLTADLRSLRGASRRRSSHQRPCSCSTSVDSFVEALSEAKSCPVTTCLEDRRWSEGPRSRKGTEPRRVPLDFWIRLIDSYCWGREKDHRARHFFSSADPGSTFGMTSGIQPTDRATTGRDGTHHHSERRRRSPTGGHRRDDQRW